MRKLLLTPLAFVAAGALVGAGFELFIHLPCAFMLGLALAAG